MSEQKFCPLCGNDYDEDDVFCSKCGNTLAHDDSGASETEATAVILHQSDEAEPKHSENAAVKSLFARKSTKAAKAAKSASMPITDDDTAVPHSSAAPVMLTQSEGYKSDDAELTVAYGEKKRGVSGKALLIAAVAVLLVLVIIILAGLPSRQAGRTPASTVKSFVRLLKKSDADAVLKLFSCDYKAENFDYNEFIKQVGVYTLAQPSPNDGGFYSEINELFFRAQSARELKNFCYSLLLPQETGNGPTLLQPNKVTPEQYAQYVDAGNLKGLRVVRVDVIEYTASAEKFEAGTLSYANVYKTTGRTDVYVLLQLDGNYYAAALTLVNTPKGWKIDTLCAQLPELSTSAAAVSTTRAEYDALVKGTK